MSHTTAYIAQKDTPATLPKVGDTLTATVHRNEGDDEDGTYRVPCTVSSVTKTDKWNLVNFAPHSHYQVETLEMR